MYSIPMTGTVASGASIAPATTEAGPRSALAEHLGGVRNVAEGRLRAGGEAGFPMDSGLLTQDFMRRVLSSFEAKLDAANNLETAARMETLIREDADRLFFEAVGEDVALLFREGSLRDALLPRDMTPPVAWLEAGPAGDVNARDSQRMLVESMVDSGSMGDLEPNGGAASAA